MRLLAVVEYDGTDFAGFQFQSRPMTPPGEQQRTVQGELERAISSATGAGQGVRRAARVVGAGRTDGGVHATGQVVHFDTEGRLVQNLGVFKRALNAHLSRDVSIRALHAAPPDFHARFSAVSRTYVYRILNGGVASPLLRRYAYHVAVPLSVEHMADAAQHLLGLHDFRAFGVQVARGKTYRRVSHVSVSQSCAEPASIWHTQGDAGDGLCRAGERGRPGADVDPPWPASSLNASTALAGSGAAGGDGTRQVIEVKIEANAFLRHMMRRIVGTLVRVGRGTLEAKDMAGIIAATEQARAGPSVPACGLCLVGVSYPPSRQPAEVAGSTDQVGEMM